MGFLFPIDDSRSAHNRFDHFKDRLYSISYSLGICKFNKVRGIAGLISYEIDGLNPAGHCSGGDECDGGGTPDAVAGSTLPLYNLLVDMLLELDKYTTHCGSSTIIDPDTGTCIPYSAIECGTESIFYPDTGTCIPEL